MLLALGLVMLSLGLVGGFVALMGYDFGVWGNGRDDHRAFNSVLARTVVFASLIALACLLAYLWAALLKYYRYEAHTLRPLDED